jgi:hypothetical protein
MNTETCVVKIGVDNRPCGKPVVYLSAQQAMGGGRGQYSGWYHLGVQDDAGHRPVPKKWMS